MVVCMGLRAEGAYLALSIWGWDLGQDLAVPLLQEMGCGQHSHTEALLPPDALGAGSALTYCKPSSPCLEEGLYSFS